MRTLCGQCNLLTDIFLVLFVLLTAEAVFLKRNFCQLQLSFGESGEFCLPFPSLGALPLLRNAALGATCAQAAFFFFPLLSFGAPYVTSAFR